MLRVKCRILHVEGEKITKNTILRSGNRFDVFSVVLLYEHF